MINRDLESKLTPAASRLLQELVDSYRDQILIGAAQSAASVFDEADEISVRDIVTSVNYDEIRFGRFSLRSTDPLSNRLRLTVISIGILFAISGITYFVFESYDRSYVDSLAMFSLLFIVFGFLLLISVLWSTRARLTQLQGLHQFDTRRSDRSMPLVLKWRDIELALRDLVASRMGESVANQPISKLVQEAQRAEILNREDLEGIRRLLVTRNSILHKGLKLDPDHLSLALKEADRILSKLERARER